MTRSLWELEAGRVLHICTDCANCVSGAEIGCVVEGVLYNVVIGGHVNKCAIAPLKNCVTGEVTLMSCEEVRNSLFDGAFKCEYYKAKGA